MYANRREFRVVGMSRSGNHAIIDWILAQAPGRTCFLNCAEPGTNPFASARPLAADAPGHRVSYEGFDLEDELAGRHSAKHLLVHSYEDTFLGPLSRHDAQHHVGMSEDRVDVLILRDPFNLFASRLASGVGTVSPTVAARIWCQHAREFLDETRHLPHRRVPVSYNAWVTSRSYRRDIAAALGLRFDDIAASRVARTAGGSSFDGVRFDGRASKMRVLRRWEHHAQEPGYRALFTPALLELSHRIFGAGPARWLERAA